MTRKDRSTRKEALLPQLRPLAWVIALTGKSKPTIYRWEREGLFPKRFRLGANSTAWLESEVTVWLDARIAGKNDNEIRQLVEEQTQQRQVNTRGERP